MKRKTLFIVAIGIIIIVTTGMAALWNTSSAAGKYDEFAQCLTSNGVKMYGAFWCPHCAEQKLDFGDSWQYVDYVECSPPDRSGQLPACTQAGIKAYPTWVFPDGSRTEGALPLEQLGQKTGCSLEQQKG